MKNILFIFLAAMFIFSCKRGKQEMLEGTWQAVSLENHEMDSVLSDGQAFMDTVGNTTDTNSNLELYGIADKDSIKMTVKTQLDSLRDLQQEAVLNTVFTFKKNGEAVLRFGDYTDSTKWYFDDDGALMLDELKEKGAGDKMRMEVVALTDTVLKLKLIEDGSNSTVTFHPKGK